MHGSAAVQTAGKVTTVTTTNGTGTNHSALDWRSFSVPGGSTVFFAQPNASSLSINRVLGGDPSSIAGTLGSNGRLVLVNPAGIAVAPGALVDTAGFTASTLAMSRSDAIAGRLAFGGQDSDRDFAGKGGVGQLQVRGHVLARSGDVVLIGRNIETDTSALVEAIAGDVVLAAGHTVEVTGRGMEGILMQVRAPDDRAVNLGTLRGDSVAVFAGQLRHSGVVQANSATASGGRVVLQASDEAELEGSVSATALGHGGSVMVTADKLTLKSPASIDVSHANGGGEILVGGGWQGQDSRIVNAQQVEVDQGVLLKADATLQGGGGTVVVWSEQSTQFAGTILSRGAGGGAGGRVEVSGARSLSARGTVDVIGFVPPATSSDGKGKGGPGGSGDGSGDGNSNTNSNSNSNSSGNESGNGSGSRSGSGNDNATGNASANGSGKSGGNDNASGNNDVRADSDKGSATSTTSTSSTTSSSNAIGSTPASITTVALVPREVQPEAVQAALREPAAASESFIQRTSATLQSPTPDAGDGAQRKVVVVNDTRCVVVTR